jgi:hypothetical protein
MTMHFRVQSLFLLSESLLLQTLFGEDEIPVVLFFLEQDWETNHEVNYQLVNFTGALQ